MWHHGSFGLFRCFVGKLSHSRLVSLMLDYSLFFCINVIFVSKSLLNITTFIEFSL